LCVKVSAPSSSCVSVTRKFHPFLPLCIFFFPTLHFFFFPLCILITLVLCIFIYN
jgi:hypothetical protein